MDCYPKTPTFEPGPEGRVIASTVSEYRRMRYEVQESLLKMLVAMDQTTVHLSAYWQQADDPQLSVSGWSLAIVPNELTLSDMEAINHGSERERYRMIEVPGIVSEGLHPKTEKESVLKKIPTSQLGTTTETQENERQAFEDAALFLDLLGAPGAVRGLYGLVAGIPTAGRALVALRRAEDKFGPNTIFRPITTLDGSGKVIKVVQQGDIKAAEQFWKELPRLMPPERSAVPALGFATNRVREVVGGTEQAANQTAHSVEKALFGRSVGQLGDDITAPGAGVGGVTEYSGLPISRARFRPLADPYGLLNPLPAGGTTTQELLAGNYSAPGRAGVTLNQKTIEFRDLWALTEKYGGVEYSLTREVTSSGKNVYRLYSGQRGSATVPNTIFDPVNPGSVLRRIAHTHPSGNPYPSFPSPTRAGSDVTNINNDLINMLLQDPYARVPHSRIIYGPGATDSTIYYPNFLR